MPAVENELIPAVANEKEFELPMGRGCGEFRLPTVNVPVAANMSNVVKVCAIATPGYAQNIANKKNIDFIIYFSPFKSLGALFFENKSPPSN